MSNQLTRTLKQTTGKVKLLFDPGVVPLNQAIELEERAPSRSLSQLTYAICAIVVLAILWSAITRVDIATNAPGRVIPEGDLVAIQHLEGGVIAGIFVSEGDHVKKGQTLLQLAALDNEGKLAQLKAKRAARMLSIEGDRAIFAGTAPNFDAVVSGFAEQKAEQLSLYTARQRDHEAQRTILTAQKTQRSSEVNRLSSQLMVLRRDEQSAAEELALRMDLFARKLTTRDRLYGAKRDATDSQKQRMNAHDQLTRAESELNEYEHKLLELETKIRADAQEQISKSTAELAEIEAALKNEEGHATRLNLKAPVDGIVSGLNVRMINAVVKPGETMMELVPTNEPLMVLANVAPQDIGQVEIGQPADVRVSAYDYATYGTLQGTVDRISASTASDPEGRQFYKMRVRLARDYFGHNSKKTRLLPGMEVEVDVKTGSRSILSYLLKPVTRTWDTAMREP
ncbi:MAG: HlyD family type I secretion periplasmic adaptor subunit [Micropepsaceae bacterium]